MHPKTFMLSLAALASVAISTEDKENGPSCPEDEYYNTMMASKNRHAAATDCAKWLGGTITDPKEIPRYLKDCGADTEEDRVSRVSAACSCIATSTVSTTLSTQTHVSSTSSSASAVTTSSQPPSGPPSSSSVSTGSTSRPQSTPSSSGHPSTTSVRPSSHPPSTATFSTAPHSSGPSSSQITSTTTGTGLSQTIGTSLFHTSSSQSVPPSPSGSTSLISTGHAGSLSTISHSSTSRSTVTAPRSSLTDVAPSQASTTSFTTSTICMYSQLVEQARSRANPNHTDTESIYTTTSCAPGKLDCPAASTILVTSTIAISTTICPVAETPRPSPPQQETTTQWKTSTICKRTNLVPCDMHFTNLIQTRRLRTR